MTTKTFTFAPAEGITANVRAALLDGAWWFVAADVCSALGLSMLAGTAQHTKHIPTEEKQTLKPATLGRFLGQPSFPIFGKTLLSFVSEPGLYKLIMRCDKPVARTFQDWVTRDVLPAIRKDGAYVMGEEKVATGEMSEDEFVLKAMGILQGKVERLRVERDEAVRKAQAEAARADVAQAEAETLKPKAEVSRRGLPQRQPGQLRWSAILLGWVPLGLRERGPQFHLPSGQASTPTRRSFQSPAPARRAGRSAACRLPNHLSFGTPSERRPGSRRR